MRNELPERIKREFDAAGVEIPFPHITVIAGDGTEDPYAEIRERLTTPPPAGELIDTFADSFVDPVPNPCNPAEVDISVEVTGSVYDQGGGTLLVVQEAKTSTESGFEGTGFLWLLEKNGVPEPGGFFESGLNEDTDETYIRYAEGVFPEEATTDCLRG